MRRPGIRTVLLGMSLLLISLPIAGIKVMRVYESALIRQTETGLITQSALIAAQFREELLRLAPLTVSADSFGRAVKSTDSVNVAPTSRAVTVDAGGGQSQSATQSSDANSPWKPRPAVLDLAQSAILPSGPETRVDGVAHEYSVRVGKLIQPILTQAQVTTLAGLRVVDYTGVVVASTGDDIGHYLGDTVEMQQALEGRAASVLREREPEEANPAYSSISRGAKLRVHVTAPVIIGERVVGAVQAVRTPRTLGAALYYNRKLLTMAACMLLALALLAGLITSYAIVRPIKELRSQSLRAMAGEVGAMTPLARPVTHDIEQLSLALSSMAQNLQQRADYVRQFATHVSHEFKTPLTAMQGSIELLQDHLDSMTEQEQRHFLYNLDGDVKRLRRMVDELLKLTTISSDGVGDKSGSLTDAMSEVAVTYASQQVQFDLDTGEQALLVSMTSTALVSIFSSLIGNAFDHGADSVRINVRADSKFVVINIIDDGPGIAPENHERIFDALFTTREHKGGHGLGLAVVASLVRTHGGSIRSRQTQSGANIEVRLPRAEENV